MVIVLTAFPHNHVFENKIFRGYDVPNFSFSYQLLHGRASYDSAVLVRCLWYLQVVSYRLM